MVDIKKYIKNGTDLSDKADYHKSIFNHLQSSQQIDTDLLDEVDYHKSIFNLFNHLNENETKTNKTALKYITKKQKLQLLDDDTDDIDISDKDYRKSIFDLFNHLQSSE